MHSSLISHTHTLTPPFSDTPEAPNPTPVPEAGGSVTPSAALHTAIGFTLFFSLISAGGIMYTVWRSRSSVAAMPQHMGNVYADLTDATAA